MEVGEGSKIPTDFLKKNPTTPLVVRNGCLHGPPSEELDCLPKVGD